jgi:hypothetical protein
MSRRLTYSSQASALVYQWCEILVDGSLHTMLMEMVPRPEY